MDSRGACVKIANARLKSGLADSALYRSREDFEAGFKTKMAHSPRVIKHMGGRDRGKSQGVWVCYLVDGEYIKSSGEESSTALKGFEQVHIHKQTHTCTHSSMGTSARKSMRTCANINLLAHVHS